ncbi:MAG: hypothetical protein QOE70_4040 [Chthoniobacter sp.]|jgi:hypothetical protein|nr:hypothetical protein [Chthoniobacter sp.]
MPGLDPSLAGAFIDGGHQARVLGVRLRRFSLWHVLLMQTLDSPFLREGGVSLHDLRTAIGLCRLRFEDSQIRRPWIGPISLLKLCRRGGLHREVLRFIAYTADYVHKPEYSVRPPKLPPGATITMPGAGAPEIFKLASDVIGWSHWPEAHVWEMSPGRAHWYRTMKLQAQGADVDFMTPEDRAFDAGMKAAGLKRRGSKDGRA